MPAHAQPSLHAHRETFAQRYCRRRGLAAEAYANAVLDETLYPHARLVRWLLRGEALTVDRRFVVNVGQLRQRRDYQDAVREFFMDRDGATWPRRVLRLRISARRMQSLVWEVLE